MGASSGDAWDTHLEPSQACGAPGSPPGGDSSEGATWKMDPQAVVGNDREKPNPEKRSTTGRQQCQEDTQQTDKHNADAKAWKTRG